MSVAILESDHSGELCYKSRAVYVQQEMGVTSPRGAPGGKGEAMGK